MTINKKSGFSMLELVVVMLIMGTLARIRISKMSGSDLGAIKASMKSDIRNTISTINACFRDTLDYTKCVNTTINFSEGETSLTESNYKLSITKGNYGSITNSSSPSTFPTVIIKNNRLPRGSNMLQYDNTKTTISDFQ